MTIGRSKIVPDLLHSSAFFFAGVLCFRSRPNDVELAALERGDEMVVNFAQEVLLPSTGAIQSPLPADPIDAVVDRHHVSSTRAYAMQNVLMPDDKLVPEGTAGLNEIFSTNLDYRLVLESNGPLVLIRQSDGARLWTAPGTVGQPVEYALMQPNGNFVVDDTSGNRLWASKTFNHPGSFVVVHNDGFVAVFDPVDAIFTKP